MEVDWKVVQNEMRKREEDEKDLTREEIERLLRKLNYGKRNLGRR